MESPPATSSRPSASSEVPGQNMSWWVFATVVVDDELVLGSNKTVTVWSGLATAPETVPDQDDQATILPSGRIAAAAGETGLAVLPSGITLLHRPLASESGTYATTLVVHKKSAVVAHTVCTS